MATCIKEAYVTFKGYNFKKIKEQNKKPDIYRASTQ